MVDKTVSTRGGSASGARGNSDGDPNCAGCPEQARVAPMAGAGKYPAGGAVLDDCLGRSLEQLSGAFSSSARRWELIVYPSLVAFIILAIYGFYLIYSLTKDVSRVAGNMEAITQSMYAVAANMDNVAGRMETISGQMENVTHEMHLQVQASTNLLNYMEQINTSMHSMNVSMDQMRYHAAIMNQNISRPMSLMNTFLPW